MSNAWNLMSDKHFKEVLAAEESFDHEGLQLVLLSLFYKTKRLEEQLFAIQSLIMTKGMVTEQELAELLDNSKSYLQAKDEQKYKQVELWKSLGLSFEEMVHFSLKGNFTKSD